MHIYKHCKDTEQGIGKQPVDEFEYVVTNVEAFTEMGSSFMKEETSGYFIKVYMNITNTGSSSEYIYTPRFTLIDEQERRFDRRSDDALYIDDALDFGTQLQPGLTKTGAIVFEVPRDFEGLGLIITGDWLSTTNIPVIITDIEFTGADTSYEEMLEESMQDYMSNW